MALANRFTIEPIWKDKTAVIIAGGPSLSLAQIRHVAIARHRPASNIRVIAVNDAIFPAWYADWLHAGDATWWYWHIQSVHTNPCIKTTLAEDIPAPWVSGYLKQTGQSGFDDDRSSCRAGGSSAYQAMCIAAHLGVRKIIAIGLDMKKSDDGKKHWFGDHPGAVGRVSVDYAKNMAPHFDALADILASKGISVMNASPGTALAAFPINDLEAELNQS